MCVVSEDARFPPLLHSVEVNMHKLTSLSCRLVAVTEVSPSPEHGQQNLVKNSTLSSIRTSRVS